MAFKFGANLKVNKKFVYVMLSLAKWRDFWRKNVFKIVLHEKLIKIEWAKRAKLKAFQFDANFIVNNCEPKRNFKKLFLALRNNAHISMLICSCSILRNVQKLSVTLHSQFWTLLKAILSRILSFTASIFLDLQCQVAALHNNMRIFMVFTTWQKTNIKVK